MSLLAEANVPSQLQAKHKVVTRELNKTKTDTGNSSSLVAPADVKTKGVAVTKRTGKTNFENIDLVLPKLPTLKSELEKSDVVVLYFAASWCKMSDPISAKIDRFLGPKLQEYQKITPSSSHRRPLSLIYVSSDKSKLQFKDYTRNRFWKRVPFTSGLGERKLLKRYFKVCAKRELEELHMTREHEIPFFVVLDGKTHKTLSIRGIEALKLLGEGTLKYWGDLAKQASSKAGRTTAK